MAMEISMPKYVDSLPQILWWEADEFTVIVCLIGFGVIFHQTMASILGMIVAVTLLKRLKRGALDGTAQHVLCSTGIVPFNKEFDDLLEKEFYA